MGFWHTGYLDKIDLGLDGYSFDPSPNVFTCPDCQSAFSSQEDLLQHRFQEHPFQRPTLLLRGEELPSIRKIITRQISFKDVIAVGCERVTVDNRAVKPKDIGKYLAKSQNGTKRIVLENKDVSSEYEMNFHIPIGKDIQEIDRRFFDLSASGIMDTRTIDAFVKATENCKSAIRYIDGIVQYLDGILAKDQKGNTCLEFSKYPEKCNLAMDALHDFETPVARIISGIVNYNFNVFKHFPNLRELPKLNASIHFFEKSLNNKIVLGQPMTDSLLASVGKIPVDSFTDRVIAWSLAADTELSNDLKNMINQLNNSIFPPDDQFKLRVIIAEYLYRQKEFSLLREMVRPVINDALYGSWAENLANSISQ